MPSLHSANTAKTVAVSLYTVLAIRLLEMLSIGALSIHKLVHTTRLLSSANSPSLLNPHRV